jgi:hypothetical protein
MSDPVRGRRVRLVSRLGARRRFRVSGEAFRVCSSGVPRGDRGCFFGCGTSPVLPGVVRRYCIRHAMHMPPFRGTPLEPGRVPKTGESARGPGETRGRARKACRGDAEARSRRDRPVRFGNGSDPHACKDLASRPPCRPEGRSEALGGRASRPPGRESSPMTAPDVPRSSRTGERGDLDATPCRTRSLSERRILAFDREDPRSLLFAQQAGVGKTSGRFDYFLTPPAAATNDARGSARFSSVVSSRPLTKFVIQPVRMRHLRV